MSEKCYLCGSTDGKCNHFPTTPSAAPVARAGAAEIIPQHGHDLHRRVFMALNSYQGGGTFLDGVERLLTEHATLTADLERSRQECEGLREALASLIGATRHLNPCPGTMEQALAALAAGQGE